MLPEPEEYWSVWPLPSVPLERWPEEDRGADDRDRLIDALESLRDPSCLAKIDLDPGWDGFFMLDEAECQAWMGAFFHHIQRNSLQSVFSAAVFNAFEILPTFDPRYPRFLQDKAIYSLPERRLILRLMEHGYETEYAENWRYWRESLAYWSEGLPPGSSVLL